LDDCGWLAEEGSYGCGGSGTDPSLEYGIECPLAPVDDIVEDSGSLADCDGLTFAGCCSGDVLYWCDSGGIHALDCSLNPAPLDTCGWSGVQGYYDCGGTGADPTGENPALCPDLAVDASGPEEIAVEKCTVGTLYATGCMDVPFEGCCGPDGALYFCEKGKYLCVLDCNALLPPLDTCGWHPGLAGYYDCGGDGADPDGLYPYSCPSIFELPDLVSDETGQVEATCPTIPSTGCCDGTYLKWCEAGLSQQFDCATMASDPVFGAYVYCGTNDTTGRADCLKKPDPSPPACISDTPEPPPEVSETYLELPPELMPDVPVSAEVIPDGLAGESVTDEGGGNGEGSHFVIPAVEAEPEPKKKSGRCSSSPRSRGEGGLPLLALLLLLVSVRMRSRTIRG